VTVNLPSYDAAKTGDAATLIASTPAVKSRRKHCRLH
jgi:hypothetical protein